MKKTTKIYLANGKEVKMGDTIINITKEEDPFFGEKTISHYIVVTEDTLPKLFKAGIITTDPNKGNDKTKEEAPTPEIPMELGYYIEQLGKRLGWKGAKVGNYLDNLHKIYPAAAFSLILREVALTIDRKYKDHISDSPEIYVISMFDGRITKANKAHIKSYKNFAAFRSMEDAKIACAITREVLKELF